MARLRKAIFRKAGPVMADPEKDAGDDEGSFQPFPEAFEGEAGQGWEVIPPYLGLSPGTQFETKTMIVPDSGSVFDRNTRRHEMGHVAISPKEAPIKIAKRMGVEVMSLQAVEDCRVFRYLHGVLPEQSRIELTKGAASEADIESLRKAMKVRYDKDPHAFMAMGARLLVSVYGSNAYSALFHAMGSTDLEGANLAHTIAQTACGMIGVGTPPPWTRVRKACEYLDKVLAPPPPEEKKKEEPESSPKTGKLRPKDAYRKKDASEEKPEWGEHEETEDDEPTGVPHVPELWGSGDEWGEMTIEIPPRNISAKIQREKGRHRSTDSGVLVREVSRLWTDQKIFSRRQKDPGGTVLIDASGSMGLTPEQVFAIANAAPASTIAVYSGYNDKGILRILVKNGTAAERVQMARPSAGGNIIDGPAIAWLSKQPGPRIWVSDGQMTVKHERRPSDKALVEVWTILRRAKVVRTPHVEQALKLFEMKRKGMWIPGKRVPGIAAVDTERRY